MQFKVIRMFVMKFQVNQETAITKFPKYIIYSMHL